MLLVVFLLSVLLQCLAFDPTQYTNKENLFVTYELYWRVNVKYQQFHVAIRANTLGWVGFGLGEYTSGGMAGSDILIGWVDANGKAHIEDRYTVEKDTPLYDDCQSWVLVSGEESNGWTIIEAVRQLNTSDVQDRVIVSGPVPIIGAHSASSLDSLSYHDIHRSPMSVSLFTDGNDPTLIPISDSGTIQTQTFQVPWLTVPSSRTNYMCTAFALPASKDSHIIQIDPYMNSSNADLTHHMLVYLCDSTSYTQSILNNPQVCFSPIGNPFSGCYTVVYGWARGSDSIVVPPDAGFPIGPNSFKILTIEIHYDNPSGNTGRKDNSGIKIHYTPVLRPHDAATMVLGDPLVNAYPIVGNSQDEFQVEYECTAGCSGRFSNPEINIFASMLHMHSYGKKMWTTHWRGDVQLEDVDRVEYFSYDFQHFAPVKKVIKQGDRLNTHCVYDTSEIPVNSTVKFGTASNEEMCMHFVTYWPKLTVNNALPFSFCGYARNSYKFGVNRNYTLCGDPLGAVVEYNPVNYDEEDEGSPFATPPSQCIVNIVEEIPDVILNEASCARWSIIPLGISLLLFVI